MNRYRGYVFSYLSALLVGSVLYDRATQLDRAFLVLGASPHPHPYPRAPTAPPLSPLAHPSTGDTLRGVASVSLLGGGKPEPSRIPNPHSGWSGLLLVNVGCWLALALAEPDAPAAAWVKAVASDRTVRSLVAAWRRAAPSSARWVEAAPKPPLDAAQPLLALSGPAKTVLASVAGATIALPSSLPFALFSLDFGKEGAAVLSGLLSVVGSVAALSFLRSFPSILRARGWFGVHACLAAFSSLAALAMGAVMPADYFRDTPETLPRHSRDTSLRCGDAGRLQEVFARLRDSIVAPRRDRRRLARVLAPAVRSAPNVEAGPAADVGAGRRDTAPATRAKQRVPHLRQGRYAR